MKLLQALLTLFACAYLPLHAASLDDLTYTTANGEVTITNCDTAATGELIIPDTIEGNPVTSIGEEAFYNCISLTSITIPVGVSSIGVYAFTSCSSLESLNVTNSNVNFTDVSGVLFDAEMELLLTYPAGKDDLSYNIPNSVTSIGDSAFDSCSSLTSITIPDSVTSIDDYAFYGCTNLTSIPIPNSVNSIGGGAFVRCTSLISITIPDGVTRIGEDAFDSCSSLTSITIPDSVTSIDAYAFYGCSSLTSITIPDGVTSIGGHAFEGCSRLTSLIFQGSAPNVGISVFLDVSSEAVAFVTSEALSSFGESGGIWNGLSIQVRDDTPNLGEIAQLKAQLAQMTAERDAAIAQRDARPTQAAYDTVVTERDARPTIEEVKDARLGSVMLQSDVANQSVKIRFLIEETDDFRTWIKRDEINEITVPLEVGKRFYRFALEDE